ncbi:hypothetical protein CEE37_01650 [candidate division LCP-89 bacterium B3_LCP]|uniref:Haem-binding uptake Tiki superfamily ChaN domain-containing protein n=1 Tax=candidate division LCP-89 bacterium B3_LCP TaxID=2012998 RepID=A0A532V5C6_UNCL8|nr:MAG: hypothetical protein CEE37_01650 [candidate division LCP-89 bacterium B3_LCP]
MKNLILHSFCYFVIAILLLGCSTGEKLPEVAPELMANLSGYLKDQQQTPEEYILNKFEQHDVIFIGEYHRIKQNVELISRLIPILHQNGIYYLCTEFARREDQHLIDSLLTSPEYDEALARLITFNQYVFWGFQEYCDIYKSAWELNHNLPEESRKFRILGVNDSPDWSYVKTPRDRDKHEVMKKVWQGGGEHLWAKVILDEVIANGERTLVYSGIHHAFSEYKQPIVSGDGKFIRFEVTRMGNHVFSEVGKRAITIYLHALWPSADGYGAKSVYTADGVIDAVMAQSSEEHYPVGFDVRGTPFGKLPGQNSLYHHGYDDFTLEMFCDGYIFQVPFAQYQGVTPIDGFIDDGNIETARLQAPNPKYRDKDPEHFMKSMARTADMERRFKGY